MKKDNIISDFEVVNFKIVGYRGRQKEIVIPNGLQLGEGAFSNCSRIKRVTLNEEIREIPDSAFSNCKKLTELCGLEQVERIGRYAFFGCERLKKIDLPVGIKKIDDHTFYGCASLEEIAIPENVLEIGYAAFYDCKNLRSITFSKGLKEIGSEAFLCCDGLEKINIPQSVERIGVSAFEFCENLKRVSFSSRTLVERNVFSNTPWEAEQTKGGAFVTNGILHKVDENIEEYIVPQEITQIATGAFCKSNIKKLTIPKNVEYIGVYAFADSQIAEIHFECMECEFGRYLFDGCSNIKEIILPRGMKSIYEYTFGNVNAIVEIPESVEFIDDYAFALSPHPKSKGMKPKIRAKAGSLGAEFAKEHGMELILK